MTADQPVQLEQLTAGMWTGWWVWIYQTPGGGFYRSPGAYKSKQAARKAGCGWLERRQNPRNRGR